MGGLCNVQELDISGNTRITSVKHLKKLIKLAAHRSGVPQAEINELCASGRIEISY